MIIVQTYQPSHVAVSLGHLERYQASDLSSRQHLDCESAVEHVAAAHLAYLEGDRWAPVPVIQVVRVVQQAQPDLREAGIHLAERRYTALLHARALEADARRAKQADAVRTRDLSELRRLMALYPEEAARGR